VTSETRHEVAVEPPAGTPGIPLVFVPVPDAKTVPKRGSKASPPGSTRVGGHGRPGLAPALMEESCSVRSDGLSSAIR
jgi:hypothetical protein